MFSRPYLTLLNCHEIYTEPLEPAPQATLSCVFYWDKLPSPRAASMETYSYFWAFIIEEKGMNANN